MNNEDLREQLLQVKKVFPNVPMPFPSLPLPSSTIFPAHSMALRENAHCRTRLRITERECKRRETEIQRLLSSTSSSMRQHNSPSNGSSSGGRPSPEARLELAAVKRKLMLYERLLHEKSQENAKLLADKSVAQSSEARKLVDKLEGECQRLRTHLAQSVPEAEFLREKDQYLAIINRLVEENMHLRQVIGQFEHRRRESEKLLTQLGGGEALVRQFRHSSISSRKQANFYKNALGNLLKGQRGFRLRTESLGSHQGSSLMLGGGGRSNGLAIKAMLENGHKKSKQQRRRASVAGMEELLLVEELKTLEEAEEEENGLAETEEVGTRKTKMEGGRKKKGEEPTMNKKSPMSKEMMNGEDKGRFVDVGAKLANAMINGHRPRSASNPDQMLSTSSSRSQRHVVEEGREEQHNGEENGAEDISSSSNSSGSSRRQRRAVEEAEEEEVEEEEEAVDEAEEPENLETHLTALYRLLHAHALRQQMVKIRQDREPPNHLLAGVHLF